MWTLLMLALCSSLQLVAVSEAQLQRQPVGAAPYLPACNANEEYQQCGCLRTCCNGGKPEGCAAACTAGCFCKDGLVKNKNGDCVPLKDCNKTTGPPTSSCGPNEVHYDCVPTCRTTCDNYDSKNTLCPEYCLPGCFCKKGWVKNKDGKCVPTSQCTTGSAPERCGPDEEYYPGCMPNCRNTCDTFNSTSVACPQSCAPGCFCKKGWVKNSEGKCVPTSQCSPNTGACPKDEEYYPDCAPSCQGTCYAYNNPGIRHCPRCLPGCWCRKGLYRRQDGKCVEPSQCDTTTGPAPSCGENEVYYKDCAPSCTGSCDTYGKEAVILCPVCRPGCWCRKGLVKNKEGKCVPVSQCDKPTGECGADEEYQECGTLCPRTCKNLPYQIRCIAGCNAGCFCKEGLVRNDDNVCVKPEQCPSKECGAGEEYQECGTLCPRTCENLPYQIRCIAGCKAGCFCQEGLVRNYENVCVKPEQCNQCKANEEYKQCGSACPKTCSNLGKRLVCTAQCVSGCFCKEGFVKDDNGVCVEPSECPTEKCGANEEYTTCGSACPETCENKDRTIFCTLQCVPGCFCKKGFVRNAQGRCINESQCQPSEQCGVNEIFKECGSACPPTCSNRGKRQICTQQCVKGCFCKGGYVRNSDGRCVRPNECQNQCGKDEVYQECGTACPRTCASLYTKIRCIEKCVSGCFCRDDLVRHEGKCIDIRDCQTQQCGANEEYQKCGSACPPTCANLGNPPTCPLHCVNGCFCKSGFVKNDQGLCVKPSECPSNQCGIDEVYNECGTACPRTCDSIFIKIRCIDKCVPGCFCRDDLVRHNGKCIDIKECPIQQCGFNEEYTKCGSACPATCSNLSTTQPCPAHCVTGCFCKEGYVKNDQGVCVQPSECPSNTCGENEQFYGCIPCGHTCENIDEEVFCTQECRPGCACRRGYVRSKDGKCVLPDQCPTVCKGLNEAYVDCAKPCSTCEIRGNCKLKRCEKGCDCKPHFFRNSSGICIPEDQCPVSSEGFDCEMGPDSGPCKAHMPRFYYDKESGTCKIFIYGGCRGNKNNFVTEDQCHKRCGGESGGSDCDKDPERGPCAAAIPRFYYDRDSNQCKPFSYGGCLGNGNNFGTEKECHKKCGSAPTDSDCDKGPETGPCRSRLIRFYHDSSDGKCKTFIYGGCEGNKNNFKTKDECNKKCGKSGQCGVDEVYKECGTACPRTCKNRDAKFKCIAMCKKGCFCRDGLVRNDDGKCVEPSECPNDNCRALEEYKKCGTACPATCKNLNVKVYCLDVCVEGCFCKQGLVRNDDGECVDPSECQTEECGENEEYSTCGSACPVTCANKDTEIACTLQCVIGCFCKKGYVRNEEGKCILSDQCPTDTCPANEEYSNCVNPCNTCDIRGQCNFLVCNKGCDCKKGYYRDMDGVCISKESCPATSPPPPVCEDDEQFYNCTPDCKNTCENYNRPHVICPRICKRGCFCKTGLVKRSDGKCVRPTECNNGNETCGRNEEYSTCGTCERTCENKDQDIACTQECRTGCFCRKGYVRNANNKCVRADRCPSETCGRNEEYSTCGTCERTCENKAEDIVCTQECRTGCFCKKGYVRNSSNKCVRQDQCPTDQCGVDEVYKQCGTACPRTCKNLNIKIACIAVCKSGCFCRDGLVRNDDGKCVDPTECPNEICGENESYSDCYTPCVVTCDNKDEQVLCTQECKVGCFCDEGYVRDGEGKCVLPEQCPAEECDGENEVSVECAKPKWCNTCYIRGNCKLAKCDRGCDCKPTYYRNESGICIPEAQCPGFCPVNEEYSDCVIPCNTCDIRGKCAFLVCNKGCDCKKGYYRDESGVCIPEESCPATSPPQPVCDEEDEEYYDCAPDCKNTCENYNKPNVACPKICRRGCFCKSGLVKRSDGKCVAPSDCDDEPEQPPERCGRHEKYYECIPNCHNTCETYNTYNLCSQLCRSGCFCKEGYVLRKDKKCVRPENCNLTTETCGRNEEYSTCGTCERTCENNDQDLVCTQECRTGCFCKRGYVRNENNRCVRPDRCPAEEPPSCGRHEKYYSCIPNCRNTCETYNKKNILCSQLCRPGCFCKEGYVLRKDKRCVRPAKCNLPAENCGRNEEYSTCGTCERTCENKDEDIVCTQECRTGCFCRKGYVRNANNKCVRQDQCPSETTPSCPKDQQYYQCIPTCNRTCMTYNSTDAYCTKECIKGCSCREGLVMNKEGDCVKPEDCPPSCDFTQQYYECMPDCQNRCNPPEFCDTLCRPGCFCREDLVLREDNMCVRKELCEDHPVTTPPKDRCGPKKEYYECYSSCKNSCANYKDNQTVCPALCEIGCFCKKGLLVDRNGKCVTPAECEDMDSTSESSEVLEVDEEETVSEGSEQHKIRTSRETGRYISRGSHNLGGNLFSVYGKSRCGINERVVKCAKPRACNTCRLRGNCNLTNCSRGCDCIPGHYRDEEGICVPESDCPQQDGPEEECGPNEEYNDCGSACPLTCDNYDQLVMCTLQCKVGCFCREGYVRNREGRCILPSECPQERRRNPPARGGPISSRRSYGSYQQQRSNWNVMESYSEEGSEDSDGREREFSRWTVYEDDTGDEEESTDRRTRSREWSGLDESFFSDYYELEESSEGSDEEDYVEEFEWFE